MWPVECGVCGGCGVNAHGYPCHPCAERGWVVRSCSCGACDDGTVVQSWGVDDDGAGAGYDERDVRCVAAEERPATERESALAHNRHMALAKATSQAEVSAILSQYDEMMHGASAQKEAA